MTFISESLYLYPYDEALSIYSKPLYPKMPSDGFMPHVWCVLHIGGHASKIFIKPIIYSIATLSQVVFSLYRCIRLKDPRNELAQGVRFFACIILSPFTETLKACKAAVGVLFPSVYYLPSLYCKAIAQRDATYKSDGEGNLDFSYVNPRLNFGFVIDGAGHNKPAIKKIQDPIITTFIKRYERDFQKSFGDVEEAQEFVQEQIDAFGKAFNKALPDYCPAIFFAQVVKIGNQHYMFYAHMSDTACYRKTKEGFLTSPHQPDIGFGSNGAEPNKINLPQVKHKKVSPGDEIIAFTDGIGEFLTKVECVEVLSSNTDRENLLEQFKQKIINKGQARFEATGQRGGQMTSEQIAALGQGNGPGNSGKTIKFHNPDPKNPADHDDISLFTLIVE